MKSLKATLGGPVGVFAGGILGTIGAIAGEESGAAVYTWLTGS